jgi:anthranilate synthase component 1
MKKRRDLRINLGKEESLTAVANQPKPPIIPLCAEMTLSALSPLEVYTEVKRDCGFILESVEGSEKIARYSFIGIDPVFVATIGESVDIRGSEPFASIASDPEGANHIDKIRSILSRFHYVNIRAPRFFGGMVGYFAYDCLHAL